MGEYVYNTEHGYFLLKSAHKEAVRAALSTAIGRAFDTLAEALHFIGFEFSEDDEGDVIDIFLESSNAPEEGWKYLREVVGPFVEVGSHLTFFQGTGCFAIAFVESELPERAEAREEDVECVLTSDMDLILSALVDTDRELWREMNKKYGTGELDGDSEEDVPQDGESDVEVNTSSDINKGED